jgi:hypothetical protein
VNGPMAQISARAASPQNRVPVAWSLSQMAGVDVNRSLRIAAWALQSRESAIRLRRLKSRSSFQYPGLAQAVNDTLQSCDPSGAITRNGGAKSGNCESGVHCQSRLSFGPRFREPAEMRQSGPQNEM